MTNIDDYWNLINYMTDNPMSEKDKEKMFLAAQLKFLAVIADELHKLNAKKGERNVNH